MGQREYVLLDCRLPHRTKQKTLEYLIDLSYVTLMLRYLNCRTLHRLHRSRSTKYSTEKLLLAAVVDIVSISKQQQHLLQQKRQL
jgi:hypothetical protein